MYAPSFFSLIVLPYPCLYHALSLSPPTKSSRNADSTLFFPSCLLNFFLVHVLQGHRCTHRLFIVHKRYLVHASILSSPRRCEPTSRSRTECRIRRGDIPARVPDSEHRCQRFGFRFQTLMDSELLRQSLVSWRAKFNGHHTLGVSTPTTGNSDATSKQFKLVY
jgi:hypothetical protein